MSVIIKNTTKDNDLAPFGKENREYLTQLKHKFTTWMSFLGRTTFPKYIQWYKDYYGYTGDREALIQKRNKKKGIKAGKDKFANLHYPIIRPTVDAYHASSYDAQTTIKAIAQSQQDEAKKQVAQDTVNRALMTPENRKVIKQTDFITQLLGEGFFECWFESYQDKSIMSYDNMVVSKGQDVFKVKMDCLDEFNLVYNPYVQDWYLGEKFARTINSMEEVKRKYSQFFDDMTQEDADNGVIIKGISDSLWEKIITAPQFWSQHDLSQIKDTLRTCEPNTWTFQHTVLSSIPEFQQIPGSLNVELSFKIDKKNKVIEVLRYIDLDHLVLIFNGYLVYKWPNPYWCIPFYRTSFGDMPGTCSQEGIASMLYNLQRQANAFANRWIDLINSMANPIIAMDRNIFWDSTETRMELDRYQVYERNPGKTFELMKMVDPQSVVSLQGGLQLIDNLAKEMVWLNSYSTGWEGKVERVGGAPQIKQAIHKARQSAFIDNKNETLWHLAHDVMSYLQLYLPDKYEVKIFGEDWKAEWKQLTKEDIFGRFAFEFDSSSLKTVEDLTLRAEISQAIPLVQDPVFKYLLEEELIKKLWIVTVDSKLREKIIATQINEEAFKTQEVEKAKASVNPEPAPTAPQPQDTTQNQMNPEIMAQMMQMMQMQNQSQPVEETDEEYYARTGEFRE